VGQGLQRYINNICYVNKCENLSAKLLMIAVYKNGINTESVDAWAGGRTIVEDFVLISWPDITK
jgi:hypothetical protein